MPRAEKGLASPIVTLSRSIMTPFLQFSPQRDLAGPCLCGMGGARGQ